MNDEFVKQLMYGIFWCIILILLFSNNEIFIT